MAQQFYELKNLFDEQGVFFYFSGPLSQHLVKPISSILEERMTMDRANRAIMIRAFSLVVEKVQNMLHYADSSAPHPPEASAVPTSVGVIAIGYRDEHYFVVSGNLIENRKVERVREKLTKIQHMNKEELKVYYREQRRKGPDEGSKGAGLGFIEMARKGSRPIEYEFTPIDADMSFFSIKTTL